MRTGCSMSIEDRLRRPKRVRREAVGREAARRIFLGYKENVFGLWE